jgi:hypothetical protein
MNGLKQIEVVADGKLWFLVGLDDQGNVWPGQPTVAGGWQMLWTLMKESI